MTLQEFIRSGRKGRVVGGSSAFKSVQEFGSFSADMVLADFELEPERSVPVTASRLAAAWDSMRPTSGSIALASESAFYKKIVQALGL